jgi:hypothetical protein
MSGRKEADVEKEGVEVEVVVELHLGVYIRLDPTLVR